MSTSHLYHSFGIRGPFDYCCIEALLSFRSHTIHISDVRLVTVDISKNRDQTPAFYCDTDRNESLLQSDKKINGLNADPAID